MNLIFVIKEERALAWLKGYPERLNAALNRVITRWSIDLQRHVKQDKLSGQVLHVRSGTLRRSINRKVTRTPTSIVATAGTNVEYAAAYEYGFDGDVNVKAHLRSSKNGFQFPVKSFVRHQHTPERSFLRSALKDLESQITADIKGAAKEAMK